MPTTFNLFYLGTAPEIDTVEGNITSENHLALEGLVFGGAGAEIAHNLQELSPDGSYTGGPSANAYDADNSITTETFSIDGGAPQTFDAFMVYDNTLITYTDGTTALVRAGVMQDTNGNLYLVPPSSGPNAYSDALEAKPIESVTLGTADPANGTDTYAMAADRYDLSLTDYVVEGTSGDDAIDIDYVGDPEGDKIDNGDHTDGSDSDSVVAGDGNDTVYAGDGNDTVFGELGADTLSGDSGNDYLDGGAGSDRVLGGVGSDTLVGGTGDDTLRGDSTWINVSKYASTGGTATDLTITNSSDDSIDLYWLDFSGARVFYKTIVPGETYVQSTFTENNWILTDSTFTYAQLIEGAANQTVVFDGATMGDEIIAGDGNDLVYGQWGDDTIDGGNDSDTVLAGVGDDSVVGGAGADILSGDEGADSVNGGIGDDQVVGGSGNDTLQGDDGNDLLLGDTLFLVPSAYASGTSGFATNMNVTNGADGIIELWQIDSSGTLVFIATINPGDTYNHAMLSDENFVLRDEDGYYLEVIEGAANLNIVYGDEGLNDTIFGGIGDDTIRGQYGDDVVFGAEGSDTIFGGAGDDTLDGDDDVGAGGADSIDGGAGNDQITGDVGNDTLIGGDGNDTLEGGSGADSLNGGADADTFIVEDGFGNDTIVGGETVTTGTDFDAIDASSLSSGITVVYGAEEEGTLTDGFDTISFSEIEHVTATEFDDSFDLRFLPSADSIDLAGGNDSLIDAGSNDTILGGAGSDTIIGVSTDDVGVSEIDGGSGNDSIDGADRSDLIFGGDGDDTLEAGEENSIGDDDTLYGGDGDDVISSIETDTRSNDQLFGDAGNDTITAAGGDANLLSGGTGDDFIQSGTGNDSLQGGTGSDTILGGTGADSITADDDADTIILEDNFGNDTIFGGEGVSTGADQDTLDLSAVTTGTTVDLSSNDPEAGTVSDGTSTATFSEIENIVLGGGRDTIVLADGSGADTVQSFDLTDSGDGTTNDQLDVSGLTDASGNPVTTEDVTVTDTNGDGTGDAILTFPGGESITLEGVLASQVDDQAELEAMGIPAATGDFIVEGTAGNDTIDNVYVGDPEGDMIDNNDHSDGSDDDSIVAGAGDDSILAGLGDDTIDGGADDDILTGGAGNDLFTYAAGDGNDTITDFNTGNTGTLNDGDNTNNDFIDLSGFYDNLSELYADQADDGVLNQSNATDSKGRAVDYSDNTQFGGGDSLTFSGASADNSSFTQENTGVVCFTEGTLIATERGDIPVEALRPGDLVVTRDNGLQPLLWVGKRYLDHTVLAVRPKLRPVLIKPQLTGKDAPLIVSPQHGVLFDLNSDETLVRATHLAKLKGGMARVMNGCREVTYHHILFETHQIVFSNGVPSESFFPGAQALSALEQGPRREVFELFPELQRKVADQCYGPTARTFSRFKALPDHLNELSPRIRQGRRSPVSRCAPDNQGSAA